MKKLCLLLVSMVFLSSCSFFNKKNNNEQASQQLIVGTNPFMPYMFIDDNNEYAGFDIDLARVLAEKLGRTLVIKNISFDALIIELMQGKIDVIMGGFSITKVREENMLMVHYVGKEKESLPLVFWKELPLGVKSIDDIQMLNNRTICVQPASLQEDLLARYPFIDLKKLDSVADMLMEIRYGKSIACALEYEVTAALQKRYAEIKTLTVPLPDDLRDKGIGIALRKDRQDLYQKISHLITQFKQDGTLAQLEKKWLTGASHEH